MLITQAEAARRTNMRNQSIHSLRSKKTIPKFFVMVDGKYMIDDTHPEWKAFEFKKNMTAVERAAANKARSDGALMALRAKAKAGALDREIKKTTKAREALEAEKESVKAKGAETRAAMKRPKLTKKEKDIEAAFEETAEAQRQTIIHKAKIAEEKAKQEEIKTLELKGELAPISLIKHFFSFSENMIQRLYRRPHEISPEISALYMAGDDKAAVNKIIRELEAIVKDVVMELREDIKKEGYKVARTDGEK